MKIAYILHDTDKYGGAYKSFLSMLYPLMDRGVKPLVVVPSDQGLKLDLDAQGIPTLVLNYRLNTYPYDNGFKDYLLWIPRLVARRIVNARAVRRLANQLAEYDIVHSNSSVIDIGARAAKIAGKPHIYHFRENADMIGLYYFPCKKIFYKSVTYSICITRSVQTYNGLFDKSEVIYDCININNEHSKDIRCDYLHKTNQRYLFFAGRLEYNKGIEDLLEAYALSERSFPLWVAGEALQDAYMNKLRQKVQQLGIADNVCFLGARNDVPQLMADAQATIVPSYNEGFGRILSEAMFSHCLTIGRDVTGTKEQYDNGLRLTGEEIGLRFSTIKELKDHLNRVFHSSQEQWDVVRQRAYATVCALYTPDVCADSVLNYYSKIISDVC